MFGGVGDGFLYLKEAPAGNGTEFIGFCERILELFGKAQFILDFASYHVSRKVREFIAKNAHRLKLHFTPKYTPDDNVAEAQWPAVKAAVANKPIRSRGHIAATIGEAFDAGEMRPVAPYPYTRVATLRIGLRKGGAIRARIGKGEHFCYEETRFNGRVAIPTAKDLKGEREAVLPPEKRAMLPHDLANSGLPDKFLANALPSCWQSSADGGGGGGRQALRAGNAQSRAYMARPQYFWVLDMRGLTFKPKNSTITYRRAIDSYERGRDGPFRNIVMYGTVSVRRSCGHAACTASLLCFAGC